MVKRISRKKKRRSLLEFAGIWKNMTDEEAERILDDRHRLAEEHDYWKS